ncbi:IS1 family transposase [Lyngbya aestuarii]
MIFSRKDEMWSYVRSKAKKQWIWLAIDATTRASY